MISIKDLIARVSSALGHELVTHESYPAKDLIAEVASMATSAARGSLRFRRLPWRGLILVERGASLTGRRAIVVGRNVRLRRSVVINARGGRVALGDSSVLGRHTIIDASSTLRHSGGNVVIGRRSSFADFCYIGGAGGVHVGDGVMVGQFVSIHSENHNIGSADRDIRSQGVDRRGVVIEDDCWIGAGARILDGVHLATGTVVAAGAVVTRSTQAGDVVAGVPARAVRRRSIESAAQRVDDHGPIDESPPRSVPES